jgi:2-polyprenyl-6-methoxyphenol hydroxylase-like FAD-dependent oxidoreductase
MTPIQDTTNEALVVGAGPTGLTVAAELARHGLQPRIVDRATGPADTSRAIAITARTMEVFDLMGLIDPLLASGLAVRGAELWSGGERVTVAEMAARHTPYAYGLDIPQCDTERILRDRLGELGIAVEWSTELAGFEQDAEGVTAELRGPDGEETVRAAWLVGCDGKESTIRKALGVPYEGESMTELWALLEADVDWDLSDQHWQIFMSGEGTWQGYPLPGGRWRIMCDVGDVPDHTRLEMPTAGDFEARARDRGVPLRGVREGGWSSYFRISERLAARYRVGRAFVAGDAAHCHSPAGGQGMNTGIQDAHNLAWKLALADPGQPTEALLDSYEAERRPVAKGVLRKSGHILRAQTARFAGIDRLRKTVYPTVSRLPHLGARVTDALAQVDLDYSKSPIVARGHAGRATFEGGPETGHRAINVVGLDRDDGAPARIYDALRGIGHTALMFGTAADLEDLARAAAEYGVDDWWVLPQGAEAPADATERTLRDTGGDAHAEYGVRGPAVYLIRPDGYVAYRGNDDVEAFRDALEAALPAVSSRV